MKTSPVWDSNISSALYSHEAAVRLCETGLTPSYGYLVFHDSGELFHDFYECLVTFRVWRKSAAQFKHGLQLNEQRIPVERTGLVEEIRLSLLHGIHNSHLVLVPCWGRWYNILYYITLAMTLPHFFLNLDSGIVVCKLVISDLIYYKILRAS